MFPNAKFIYLMRNPYTVFESTRSFFTNTIDVYKRQFDDRASAENLRDSFKAKHPSNDDFQKEIGRAHV